ncbi:MAG: hypothetical protein OEV76_11365 [Anaerolineae bacterium]|nr:hypothetical protein [Anaerolineae bacterium]
MSFTDPDFGKTPRELRGQTQNRVTLVATVHQPNDALSELTRATLPQLQALYGALVFLCSQTTSAEMLALLRASGATVHHERQQPTSLSGIGRVRRRALRLGITTGCDHLHLCDFDRLLHWAAHYLDELQQVVGEIANYDLLILGRTERAFATHPPYQAETERLANLVFSKVYGPERDITSGSRGLSRQAAERLLTHSREEGPGVDAEWPLIVSRFPELRSGYILCEGLEFETADRYQAEIAQAGGLERWLEAQSARPELWVQRLRVAYEIAEAALRAAECCQ